MRKQRKMGHITIVGRSMSVVENLLSSTLDEASEKPAGQPPSVMLSCFSALSKKESSILTRGYNVFN